MGNKNKQSAQSSADNEQAGQTDKTMNVTEAGLLNKQQELKELEDSLTQKETVIAQREQALKAAKDAIAKKEAELNDKHVQLEEMELQAKNGFPQLFEEKFAAFKKQLEQREAKCAGELESLEDEKEKLRQREVAVQKAEIQRDNGYADTRAKLDDELFNLRKKQEKDLESKRASALTAIEKELTEERASRIASLEKKIADRLKAHEAAIQQDRDELEQKRNAFLKDQAELDELKDELEYQKQRLQSSKERLEERETNLNVEVDRLVESERVQLRKSIEQKDIEIKRYIEDSTSLQELLNTYKKLEHDLGEDPQKVKDELAKQVETIKSLQNDLANRPLLAQEEFNRIKSEKDSLEQACNRLSEENRSLSTIRKGREELEEKIADLERRNKILSDQRDNIEAYNNKLQEDLERLQASYERGEEREERIKHIEKPLDQIPYKERAPDDDINEIQWLNDIQDKFDLVGFNFPSRILKAFHTSLKTAEWSPITVLAGVSGTGKSKLPELYAQFGGLNFLNTPVQPNWDSMESMLGFYNSIDNYFDAQPVLRFLAQSQLPPSEHYPNGLSDVMNLVLLDEMNLAHIELYFADFLSKLEERRGKKTVPNIPVKIGAKQDPYLIPMGRNVLWVGTMNQDETTKSLSDKVLDRGVVINFPRPERLERMKKLSDPSSHASKLISKKQWGRWWAEKSSFNDDQITPYKLFVEEMNISLSKVGRALGHRVWQSIEYYMSNYPDVLEAQRNNDDASLVKAMKVAFEDQLVQKVMPKLRGIETRGKSKSDCLDKIRTQLVNDDYTIIDDFDLACEFGYGQFIWNSANYLKDDAFLNESNNNDSRESIVASPEQSNFYSSSKVGDSLIPSELKRFASDNQKKLWQLTTNEIMRAMSCDVKEAKSLKDLCNKTKES